MNESTKTKKALRGSLFALFLCIVLLIGTTFAWFTDTASTGVNKIQAGNLKVDIVDAIFLNKYLATLIQFSDAQMANADCCQDGVLNDQDTTALMQFIILLIDDLPVQPTEK